MNPNYAAIFKHDINKLFAASFIKPIEEATWLSTIVIVLKKIGNQEFVWTFESLILLLKKDPHSLPFIDEVINTIAGHEVYTFLDGFLDTIRFP